MTLNGVMAVILRYFTELVYDVVVKQLPRFQNLLTFNSLWPYYNHLRNYSAIIWAKQTDNSVWWA